MFKTLVNADPKGGAPDARKASFAQAMEFIGALNKACGGKASFRLPKEEELTYVTLAMYYPDNMDGRIRPEDLKTCPSLRKSEGACKHVFTDLPAIIRGFGRCLLAAYLLTLREIPPRFPEPELRRRHGNQGRYR